MKLKTIGLILSIRLMQENGYLIHCLSPDKGILCGYVSIRSKKRINILSIGNSVHINHYSREGGLGKMSLEPIKSYGNGCLDSRILLSVVICICECVLFMMSKNYGSVEKAHSTILFTKIITFFNSCIEKTQDNSIKIQLIGEFILCFKVILHESGYGFDLTKCVSNGESDIEKLRFLSPKSRSAVSIEAGDPYKNVLLSLPQFFITEDLTKISLDDLRDGIKIIDFFLLRQEKLIKDDWQKVPRVWYDTKEIILSSNLFSG